MFLNFIFEKERREERGEEGLIIFLSIKNVQVYLRVSLNQMKYTSAKIQRALPKINVETLYTTSLLSHHRRCLMSNPIPSP